jgi:alpha-L-rhamnosidase
MSFCSVFGFMLQVTVLCSLPIQICLAKNSRSLKQPDGLLVDLLSEPLGIENVTPGFSWIVNDLTQNEYQTAYQILVASSLDVLNRDEADAWDSGKVASSESSNVVYGGQKLETRSVYYWKVRTWNSKQQVSPYSEPQIFTTAIKQEWEGKPIWLGDKQDSDFVFLRKSFNLPDKGVERAIAHVTALSPEETKQYVYKLYVNGEVVGVGPVRSFRGDNRYNVYDVTDLLRTDSENVIGALNFAKKDKRFLFQMEIFYEDGARQTVCSDESWKALEGSQVFSNAGNIAAEAYTHTVYIHQPLLR